MTRETLKPPGRRPFRQAAEKRGATGVAEPSFAFVLALCRWPPSPSRDDAVRRAAADADWASILRLARRHRVEGLIHAALAAAAVHPPPAVAAALRARAAVIARRNLEQAREALRLRDALAIHDIEPIFLKGTTLALLAYGNLTLKHARDIDLLVAPARAAEALDVLVGLGYEPVEPVFRSPSRRAAALDLLKDCEMVNRDRGTLAELHWRPFGSAELLQPLNGRAAAHRAVPVGPGALLTLDDPDLFAYLSLHGLRHGWARLKWLADVNAFLSGRGLDAVESLHAAAVARGAGHAPAVALLLCHDTLGCDLGEDFAGRLRRNWRVRWLMAVARDAMAGPEMGDRPLAMMRLEASQLLLGASWLHAASVIRAQWVGSTERLALPLPKPLHFLYGVIRPPLWMARRILSLLSAAATRGRDG